MGDAAVQVVRMACSLAVYVAPLLAAHAVHRGHHFTDSLALGLRALGALALLGCAGLALRAVGRVRSADYALFARRWQAAIAADNDTERQQVLRAFDFEMDSRWPLDLRWRPDAQWPQPLPLPANTPPASFNPPLDALAWLGAHTIGRRLMYPGSVWLLQRALRPQLLDGRARLVERLGGRRVRLETACGDRIDAMFVDRRGNDTARGRTLVVCCEGNAGFYELGVMGTPLDAGYSTIGWNHPGWFTSRHFEKPCLISLLRCVLGFAESTGVPWPEREVSCGPSAQLTNYPCPRSQRWPP